MNSRRHRFGRRRKDLESPLILLSELPLNQKAKIVGFSGCKHFIRHINSIGCYRGAIIKKIQNFGHHSMIQVGDCKLGLGGGATTKIIVEPLYETEES